MQVNRRPCLRGALAALALLVAAGAHAQAKPPRVSPNASSGTGLRPNIEVAPPIGVEVAPASPPASAASAASGESKLTEQEAVASNTAAGWLTLLDRRDWGTAWETSAGMVRGSVPLDKWMDGITKVRGDAGGLVERRPTSVLTNTELPGKPKGDYVTVVFSTRFEKRSVEEIVTTVREPDGRWRVAGYGMH